jgi:hypothetical protein
MRAFVIETRRTPEGNVRRRWQCSSCRYRWSEWNGQAPPSASADRQAISAEAVAEILTSQETHQELATRHGCSASTIGQIRRGELHRNICPDMPRWSKADRGTRRSCLNCHHWDGGLCDLGFPDPAEEGMGFAKDCTCYRLREAAT